jgi:hypothetical protein
MMQILDQQDLVINQQVERLFLDDNEINTRVKVS